MSVPKCKYCLIYYARDEKGVCSSKECNELLSHSCKKMKNGCGHACGGVAGELVKDCPPCLVCDVQEGAKECVICLDELRAKPMMKLVCGHELHYDCVIQQMKSGPSVDEAIAFYHVKCPLCREWLDHKKLARNVYMKKARKIYESTETAALQQAKIQELREDSPEVVEFNDSFKEYLLWEYVFYHCSKCKNVFCGGSRTCGDAADISDKRGRPICPDCCRQPRVNAWDLDKVGHGLLCSYCNEYATTMCWGNYYFCDGCHGKAQDLYKNGVRLR